MPRASASRRIAKLIERFGANCCYCTAPVYVTTIRENTKATMDHALPKSRGGIASQANLRLACILCNETKSDMTEAEFRHFMASGNYHPGYITFLEARSARRLRSRPWARVAA